MRPLHALAMLMLGRRPGREITLPEGARVERDLAYGEDRAQRLDVYLPRPPTGPLIVLVHGGAWSIGDKGGHAVVANKLAHWLPMGVVVVSVNYRMLPVAEPIEQARDVARAMAFVQQRAASWGADASRIVVIGHSTGAHLAALVAADPEFAAAEGARPWLASVLLDSAALDVVQTMSGPHSPFHDRAFGSNTDDWQQASPLHRLKARPGPMLLVHSGARPGAGDQARRFAAAVSGQGGRAELLPLALSHAEINAQLGERNDYTAKVDAFLRSVDIP
jgi:acetyl esterase/lipase